jgi:YVTN family beta-propeller protein
MATTPAPSDRIRFGFGSAPPVWWAKLAVAILVLSSLGVAYAANTPVATVPVGHSPAVVAVDPVSHHAYVGNYYGDSVTVIDGVAQSSVATVPMPTGGSIAVPLAAVVDVLSGKAYVGNFWSNYVSVIDGSTFGVVATISPPYAHGSGVRALAIDPTGSTTKIYAAIFGQNVVSVIDGSTDTIVKNIAVGDAPRAIAVFASGSHRRVYVANRYSDNVSIIDGNTDSVVATAQTGAGPKVIAVDPNRGFAYVTSPASDTVTVIDDSDHVAATVPVGDNPIGVAVDPVGRRVFVANYVGNSVSVIDADTLSVVATVATGVQPIAVAVDRSSRKAYVSCYGSSSVTVIDSSLTATSIATGYRPYALGIDEALASHQVYSANWGDNNVTVIDPPGGDSGPVTVTVDPISGDTTRSTSPTFSGTASSSRAPQASNVVAVFYRIDADPDWHRARIVAGAGSPSVRWATTPSGPLSLAPHVVHVAAMDQALAVSSSSDQGAGGDSAALSGGATYAFTVGTVPAPDTVPPTVSIFAPSDGDLVSGTVYIGVSAADIGLGMSRVEFRVDGTLVGISYLRMYAASWDSSSAAPGPHSIQATAFDLAENSASTSITVFVLGSGNNAPVAAPDAYSTAEDTTLTVSAPGLLANDTDADGDQLSAAFATGPSHGSLALHADGSCSYAPSSGWNGTDTFTYAASDGLASSTPATVTITVTAKPTPTLARASSAATIVYGQAYTFRGTLSCSDTPLPDQRVVLEVSTNGTTYSGTSLAATTAADGSFALSIKPSVRTWLRATYAETTSYEGAVSSLVLVRVKARVGTPIAPATMLRTRYYTVHGYLKPRHASGTHPVRIYKYRYVRGKWVSYGYVNARAYNYFSYTKYSASVRLPHAGRWRLRAYHADTGHAANWSSGYDYITVR